MKFKGILKIKNIFKNKNARILTENFISLSVLKVIGYIFPLLTLPYLARVIGVDSFGQIAFAVSIIVYFETITDFGFNYTATRDISTNRDKIHKVSEIFSTVIVSKVILMFFSFLVLLICLFTIPYLSTNRLLILLTFLYIPGNIIFPEWFFQAIEKMRFITIINVISKLFFTIMIFLVIKDKNDFLFIPLLNAMGFLISGIIALYIIIKKYNIKFVKPSINDIWNTIKSSWNMFVSLFLPNLYTNFSIIFLKIYSGDVATGIFSSGKRFVDIVDQLSLVVSRTFYPFLARRLDKHNFYVRITGTISIIASIFLFLSADLMIQIFYTKEFKNAVYIIRIMSISPFFLFLMNTYGNNFLVLIGKERVLSNIVFFSSLFGFVLTWISIIQFGYVGVAITLVTTWGLRGFLTFYYAHKYKKK